MRGSEWRLRAARAALRVDIEPQLRRPPGTGRANPSGQPGDGRSRGDRRQHHRPPNVGVGRPGMETFTILTGVAAPLARENVDTDLIIPIKRLVSLEHVDLGKWAFEAIRYRPDGTENPDFVLNQSPFRGASILIAHRNFGCGSSREGAVVAIRAMGIRCVIAPSFGDIFFNNCFQNS